MRFFFDSSAFAKRYIDESGIEHVLGCCSAPCERSNRARCAAWMRFTLARRRRRKPKCSCRPMRGNALRPEQPACRWWRCEVTRRVTQTVAHRPPGAARTGRT